MDIAQGGIAVPERLHDNADREKIVDLVDRLILIHHLSIDRKEVLDSPLDLRLHAAVMQVFRDILYDVTDPGLSGLPLKMYLLDEIIVDIRLQILKGKIIHLDLDLADAETVRERGVDVQRLSRLFLPLLRTLILERPEIMEAVRELYDDHADILRHGDEHLPQVLGLLLHLIDIQIDLGQLRDAVHEEGDIRIELPLQLLKRHAGILHHIVEESRGDRLPVHLQIRKNDGNTNRVDDIGLTRLSLLILVLLFRDLIGLLDHGEVFGGTILSHNLYQALIELFRRRIVRRSLQDDLFLLLCHDFLAFLKTLYYPAESMSKSSLTFPNNEVTKRT